MIQTLQQIITTLTALVMTLTAQVVNLSNNIPPTSQLAAVAPTSGLVGYWNFDEGSGTTAADTSGSGNNGALINGPSWITGKVGGALSFDGSNDSVSVNHQASLNPSEITIAFWINLQSVPASNNMSIIDKGSTAGLRLRCGNVTPCTPQLLFNSIFGASGPNLALNNWTHVTVTGNSAGTRFYINGTAGSLDTDPYIANASTANLVIGNGMGPINALIDEVRIYNRALSAQEVTDIYNDLGGSPTTTPIPPPLPPAPSPSPTPSPTPIPPAPSPSSHPTLPLPTGVCANVNIRCVGSGQEYVSIQGALDVANTNDTVLVYPGTYAETLVTIKDDGITLKAQSSIRPTLVGRIEVGSYSNVTIEGFEITGWTGLHQRAISQNIGTGLKVLNNLIRNGSKDGSATGIYSSNSTNLLVQGNEIYDTNKGININSGHSANGTYQTGIIIKDNFVHDNPIDGIDIHGEYFTVENNRVYDNMDTNWLVNHPDGIQIIASTADGYSSAKHVIIKNNTFRNHTQNIFIEGRSSAGYFAEDIYVYNNLIYSDVGATINGVVMDSLSNSGINAKEVKGAYIFNNTIGRHGGTALRVTDGSQAPIVIKNNIIANSKHAGLSIEGGATGYMNVSDLDSNLYWNATYDIIWGTSFYPTFAGFTVAHPGFEAYSKRADPKIVNVSTGAILSDSPAKDAGLTLSAYFTVDKYNTARPQGSAWDIGAYEFVSGLTSSPPLAPPLAPPLIPKPGDFNLDGIINSVDLSLMISAWNTNNSTYDLNRDGLVNSLDYTSMVQNWSL